MPDQFARNRRRSLLLLGSTFLVAAVVTGAIALLLGLGWIGLAAALALAAGATFASWWGSDRVALAVSRARPADPIEYARLHNLVEGLCVASGLPKPRIYVIDDVAPNAFATGRSPRHAAIVATTGLLDVLNRVELEAVLAQELSHVKSGDILVGTLAVTCVGAVVVVADLGIRFLWWNGGRKGRDDREGAGGPGVILAGGGFALLAVAPLVARLLQFVTSRRRQALADVSAVEMTRYPPALVSALSKLRDDSTVVHASSRATAHLWLASPIAGEEDEGRLSRLNRMFDTHPPLEERIAALQEL